MFHLETSQFFCRAKQLTDFCVKLNTGLNRVKSGRGAIYYLGYSYISLTEEFNTRLSDLVLKIVLEVINDL